MFDTVVSINQFIEMQMLATLGLPHVGVRSRLVLVSPVIVGSRFGSFVFRVALFVRFLITIILCLNRLINILSRNSTSVIGTYLTSGRSPITSRDVF